MSDSTALLLAWLEFLVVLVVLAVVLLRRVAVSRPPAAVAGWAPAGAGRSVAAVLLAPRGVRHRRRPGLPRSPR